jgi:hypothetical protein
MIAGIFMMVVGLITQVAMSDDVPNVSGTRGGLWSMSH